jgi:pilus assembly protein CpaF
MSEEKHPNALVALEPLLGDPEVVEILVDGHDRVYVEREGRFVDVPSPFRDEEHLMQVIQAILAPLGQTADASSPLADARLPDGSRVNVVLPPISLVGPVLTIRKLGLSPLSGEDLIRFGAWSEEMLRFLTACVHGRLNIVVAGGVGAGKTTVLNILAGMIPSEERIITIESAGELRGLEHLKRVVRMESRPPNAEGKGEVTLRDLVINSLRMRPDRLLLGECRGAEALHILQAMNTGHDGTMLSIHANGPHDALARFETMALMDNPSLPLLTVRQQMASAIDLITYQERLHDGKRKILKVTEVVGMRGDAIQLQDLFEFRQTGVVEGRIQGTFAPTGHIPGFLEPLIAQGIDLPASLFTPG